LSAGYGRHLFNEIASDIISADIAVFEASDLNANVMIEIGVALGDSPAMILDTKHKEYFGENPDEHDIAQMVYYSNTTGIKQCVQVYLGAFFLWQKSYCLNPSGLNKQIIKVNICPETFCSVTTRMIPARGYFYW